MNKYSKGLAITFNCNVLNALKVQKLLRSIHESNWRREGMHTVTDINEGNKKNIL